MASGAIGIRITIDIDYIGAGTGVTLMGQAQGDNPGIGSAAGPGSVGNGQTLRLLDKVAPVPGTPGALTVANFNTALTTAVSDFAAASGTPIITAALLAQINGFFTGSP
jgi:hypothetical protein